MTNNLPVTLDDKYTARTGRVMLTGIQALVRLPIMQHLRDRQAGLDTAGFISGYRGSPIGGYDHALWRARKFLEQHHIRFQPGVNEDLAATAVWGTQQLDNYDGLRCDGVFSIWYGKGPGVDRSLDPIKHGNYTGTHPNGGVLAVFGDDHPGKSSSIAHQSEQAMAACSIPVLYPATVEEIISFGLYGFALSRYAGCWVGLKTVNETVERTETIDIPDPQFQRPDFEPEGVHFRRNHFAPATDDVTTQRQRVPAARAFARANRLDRTEFHGDGKRLGIVTAGKAYLDVCRALGQLGLSREQAAARGIGLYKVGMIWPLEEQALREFADGYDELLVVEEKRNFMQQQMAEALYALASRPRLSGKTDPDGNPLLPADLQLDAGTVAAAILARLQALGIDTAGMPADPAALVPPPTSSPVALRLPYFCSGCPHNTSTRIPEGSVALAGIGCHGMAMAYREDTRAVTHMGGEGANWIGAAPFTDTPHVFQNIGDGTYFHSGMMAIRAAVAAGVNITYKLLYNDAVALTGGQPIDGPLSVADITRQLAAEGVRRIAVASDEPQKYGSNSGLAPGVTIHHRDDLDLLQRELREVKGVSALVYEQTCAAEKRRRRKRGSFPDPKKRVFINPEVCEGCGDCSVQSTCMSIFPLQTELGTKRQIDQSSCNKDYSCLKGFCPSFVTIEGADLKKKVRGPLPPELQVDLPVPEPASAAQGFACMITGIGGTGVVTIGAVLSMAALIDGRLATCFDMTGLSQKGGAVFSHLRIGDRKDQLLAAKVGRNEADLMLAFDSMAGLAEDPRNSLRPGHSRVVAQAQVVPNALLAIDSLAPIDLSAPHHELARIAGEEQVDLVDSNRIAEQLLGDSIGGNMFLLGFALQKGLLPISLDALQQAIRLNGVAVDFNLNALQLGRLYAEQPDRVEAQLAGNQAGTVASSLDERLQFHRERLTAYQNRAWADRFSQEVDRVREADNRCGDGSEKLTRTVADSLAKLMTYKDEYEVARLHTGGDFLAALRDRFDGPVQVNYHLAPPLLAKRDPVTGHLRKRQFGPWVNTAFQLLARLRFLRGSKLDIFGYTEERRTERALIEDYRQRLDSWLADLDNTNYDKVVEWAALPDMIRGYGHVKERNIKAYRERLAEL